MLQEGAMIPSPKIYGQGCRGGRSVVWTDPFGLPGVDNPAYHAKTHFQSIVSRLDGVAGTIGKRHCL